MENDLNQVQVRVLGCLLEKEMATPEYYPLSLNGLLNACNQKTNREPVVEFDEMTVARALDDLKGKQLVWQSNASRVPKYGENLVKIRNLINREAAIVCLLLVRGPQTLGELKGRSERLYAFKEIDEVRETLDGLSEMNLVVRLDRQAGRKENRYAHLLAGIPEISTSGAASPEPATIIVQAENERITKLEEEVQNLKEELAGLRNEIKQFKAQFE